MANSRKFFALLDLDFDFDACSTGYLRGTVPDRYPYGLENLPEGWELTFSPTYRGPRIFWALRRFFVKVSGFDLAASLFRWRQMRAADVVYAHCEADYLAAALLLRVLRRRRPFLVGHTIWMFAEWKDMSMPKKLLIKWAMKRVDLFIYNAEPNRLLGAEIYPDGTHVFVPFGVSDTFHSANSCTDATSSIPLILAVGNDRSRDWDLLADALNGLPIAVDIRLATRRDVDDIVGAVVRETADVRELCDLYRTAACLVVASKPNSHAGGITCILEGAAMGVPIVATDTGGVRDYLDAQYIELVAAGDVAALRQGIVNILAAPVSARERAARTRDFAAQRYTNTGYWKRVTKLIDGEVAQRS